jgi:hypothetical protein
VEAWEANKDKFDALRDAERNPASGLRTQGQHSNFAHNAEGTSHAGHSRQSTCPEEEEGKKNEEK